MICFSRSAAGDLLLDVLATDRDVLGHLAGIVLEHAADSVACLLLVEVLDGPGRRV